MILPERVDLSGGVPPESFYVPLISDRFAVEEWRASGASKDYRIPSSNWCAMTCVRMLLLRERGEAPSLEELFDSACDADVYVRQEDGSGWKGAYHVRLVHFLETLGFQARFRKHLHVSDIAKSLARGQYGLLSVGPDIRYLKDEEPEKQNGHFVFAFGYESTPASRLFRIHNSAGFASLNTQIDVAIPETRMAQVFSKSAIFVRSTLVP